MKNKFVIRSVEFEKWIDLDYRDGSDIIYSEYFENAYKFLSAEHCLLFLDKYNLQKNRHEIFKLEIIVTPVIY